MIYLLDTNICVLLIRQKSPQVLANLTSTAWLKSLSGYGILTVAGTCPLRPTL